MTFKNEAPLILKIPSTIVPAIAPTVITKSNTLVLSLKYLEPSPIIFKTASNPKIPVNALLIF